ncbi:2-keto-4-pentenoate hydratase [Microbacterium fluvii]|uniref:2-keto-4-pentenoate hydratase n=1 Tax=Microbacterium fluvii TaxID=415215 RepID=A0ABW2HEV0_9MICO|nr:fumarylacetoacetate hydrolase family protein [Microbacterium fluvii]MCU4672724.1 fumarylacetoacetate hydrolase family protein [Microbacterium fluvii]
MTTTRIDADPALVALADALNAAEETGSPVPPPSAGRELTLDEAYTVQRVNIARRLDAGERIVGRKIGLTSLAMQRQLGVDQPDFGVVTDAMVIPDGGELDARMLIAPRAEAEFAFRIGRDLPPLPSADELWDAIDGVALSIEIIDSRVADWKISLVDTVADNASSARIVYGEILPATPELLASLPAQVISMTRNGDEVAAGPGSAVLGDPLVALQWLARAIGGFGDAFAAGDIVLAGAVAAAVPLAAGDVFAATAAGFAPVSVSVSAETPAARG